MSSKTGDDYGREQESTVDFYHGSSAAFDKFREDKILLEGANGASENGRGTYFTAGKQRADSWSTRNSGGESITMRISIDKETLDNSFLSHDRVFTKTELAGLAAHAAAQGLHKAMESFAHDALSGREITGKDIATATKYSPEISAVLYSQGFKGFSYHDDLPSGKLLNVIFITTADIPPGVPVLTTAYKHLDAMAQTVADDAVPQGLKDAADKLKQTAAAAGAALGMAPERIEGAQGAIDMVTKAAVAMGEYDPLKTIHPLKNAEIAILEGAKSQQMDDWTKAALLQKALRAAATEFAQAGMEALGHAPGQSMVFKAEPAVLADPKTDPRYKDDRTAQLYHQYLQDPKKNIAAEELRTARWEINDKSPGTEKWLDNIIHRLHSPELGGNDGYSMRNSFGYGLRALARGEITPEQLVEKMEKAAYFANVDMRQNMGGGGTLSSHIGELGRRIRQAIDAPSTAAPAVTSKLANKH